MSRIATADQPRATQSLILGLEAGAAASSGHASWTEGSGGKLRAYEKDLPVRAFVDWRTPLTDTLGAVVALEFGNDPTARENGLTQAFLHWRPVPKSRFRHRFRLGAFYPHISVENTGPGWTGEFTPTASAINTWVGEELRTVGLEWSVSRVFPRLGRLSLTTAGFVANDPAGSLLAWRGWALHDRQSTLSDRLPLAALPLNQAGQVFSEQASYVAPFREVDGRIGWSSTIEWQSQGRNLVRLGYYDNQADPTVLERGQYAWHTEFHHLGMRYAVNEDLVLIAQWLAGSTEMGPREAGQHLVDNDFASYFIGLSYSLPVFDAFVRWDDFEVTDKDRSQIDNNHENGDAVTVGVQRALGEQLKVSLEWLSVTTERPVWAFNGLTTVQTEQLWQIRFHWQR